MKYSKNRTLLMSYDLYIPNTFLEWTDDFEWAVKGNNLFDEITDHINANNNAYIEEVS